MKTFLKFCYGLYFVISSAAIIILLYILITRLPKNRYQVAGAYNSCYVIDTETSQLWIRYPSGGLNLGTNSEPLQIKMPEPEYIGPKMPSEFNIEEYLKKFNNNKK